MNAPPDELCEQIERAAEARASGSNWEAVARLVGQPPEACRQWPRRHPRVWMRAYLLALRCRELELGVEAREILRQLTRSEKEATRLAAARLLLPRPRPKRSRPAAAAEQDRELADFISHVRGLCDDELELLLRESAGPQSSSATAADQPGAAGPE